MQLMLFKATFGVVEFVSLLALQKLPKSVVAMAFAPIDPGDPEVTAMQVEALTQLIAFSKPAKGGTVDVAITSHNPLTNRPRVTVPFKWLNV